MMLKKQEIINISNEVINKYSFFILNKLGFDEKPRNISLKISQSYSHALGACFACLSDKKELLEAVIVLYPYNLTWLRIGNWLFLPTIYRFSRRLLEKKLLFILAHELRHFWQYHNGEHKKNHNLSRLLPGKISLLEIDAEKWAQKFFSTYGLTIKIITYNR